MQSSILLAAMMAATNLGQTIPRSEVRQQETVYRQWSANEFVWRFKDLPKNGSVPTNQIPYSGYIYQDKLGGTVDVLRKYDRAFNRGLTSAASWEKQDSSAYKKRPDGLFGFLASPRTPDWYGHCNGWTAASIRHSEPVHGVTTRGIVFTPADIKALLAEIYVYNDHQILAGLDSNLNAGTFHAILANWLGRDSHAVAMDSDPTKEKWNYPIYGYSSSSAYHSPYSVEVNTNIRFARDSEEREFDKSPEYNEVNFFHYMLRLNHRGDIIGGYFFRDSTKIDFLWMPLRPKRAGQEGNENGNPYVNVDQVLALWRKSVPQSVRDQWSCIDIQKNNQSVARPAPKLLAKEDTPATASPKPVWKEPVVVRRAQRPTPPLRRETRVAEMLRQPEPRRNQADEACLPAAPLPSDTVAATLLKELINATGLSRQAPGEAPVPTTGRGVARRRLGQAGTAAD